MTALLLRIREASNLELTGLVLSVLAILVGLFLLCRGLIQLYADLVFCWPDENTKDPYPEETKPKLWLDDEGERRP